MHMRAMEGVVKGTSSSGSCSTAHLAPLPFEYDSYGYSPCRPRKGCMCSLDIAADVGERAEAKAALRWSEGASCGWRSPDSADSAFQPANSYRHLFLQLISLLLSCVYCLCAGLIMVEAPRRASRRVWVSEQGTSSVSASAESCRHRLPFQLFSRPMFVCLCACCSFGHHR